MVRVLVRAVKRSFRSYEAAFISAPTATITTATGGAGGEKEQARRTVTDFVELLLRLKSVSE